MASRKARQVRTEAAGTGEAAETRAGELPGSLQFMRLLWALVHGLQRQSKRMNSELGVTGPQRLVIRVVGLFPGISAGTLAAILHVHPSTLTGVLQRLVSQGLIERSAHADDRRRSVLRLTAKGTRVNSVRKGTVEAAVVASLGAVSSRDRAVAQRVLSTLADSLSPSGR